ncbi:cysteine--tRNA ligase [Kangiella profundi]|uniref:Cysteine--tRNA ligase n=1 Tax=Kangiella profundi TaxID=1561924 RepID=A0A2K9B3B0_9GAMM|nr:cysteine--tRNA ligase [Kangiella profundi]AUD79408.1 cysteine--tRNA ligase [Kangiella profundi]GGE98751.1 cysteine--tRNA ligase [Kangiella profundi]
MLQIYNNLTRQKEPFKPMVEGKVSMYVCGVTTYDLCHIGHARTYAAFDVINRYLKFRGYDVTYVRNITDIDDKIINRANENGEEFSELTERFIQEMYHDFDAIGLQRPDIEPRATRTMDEIIEMTHTLIEKGAAYAADNGDVYFHVPAFKDYGKLSKQDLTQLNAGERVDVNDIKKDPMDFALWKSSKPGEPAWDSPWGKGRPGWHIECSAMSKKCLGDTFDIHGGGSDLQFPHHENEIAQSECANGCTFANTWIHTGMVQVDKEKMSKSLGNFFTIRDVLKQYRPESVRYFLMSGHYRSQLSYSQANLESADASLERLYNALRWVDLNQATEERMDILEKAQSRFTEAMDDDFNVPEAMPVLFDLAKEVNRLKATDMAAAATIAVKLKELAGVLSLLQQDPEAFLKSGAADSDVSDEEIDSLIQQRLQARADKNWALADEIRDKLHAMNIELEDAAGGTSWRRK